MRKIILALCLVMVFGMVFSAAPSVTQVNYNPSPAIPGSTIEILVQVENTENSTKTGVIVSIADDYPFDVKSNNSVNVGSLAKHAKTTVSFTIYVDPSAQNITYPLKVNVVTDQDVVGRQTSSNIVVSGQEPNIKIVKASDSKLIPGEEKNITMTLQNIGTSPAYDVVIEMQEDRTVTATGTVVEREILPLGSASIFVGQIMPGETQTVSIMMTVNREAELKNYTIPIAVSYRTSSGERTSTTSYIGFKVAGNVNLEATLKDVVGTSTAGTDTTATIEVFNKGAGKADFVIASLEADCGNSDGIKEFIGTLEPNDVDSFRSVISIDSGVATGTCNLSVNVEYQDIDATTKTVSIAVPMMVYSAADGAARLGGGPDLITIIIVIVVIGAAIWYYKKRKGKK